MKVYAEISEMAKLLPRRSADCFIDFLCNNMDDRSIGRAIVYWKRISTITREDKHMTECGGRVRTTKKRRGKTEHPYNNAKKVINLLYKVKGAKNFSCELEGFTPSSTQVRVLDIFKKNSRDIQLLNRSKPKSASGTIVKQRFAR